MRGLTICMFIFFGNWFSSELCAQSLDDYLAIAAENNPQLTSKYALFEASLQRVTQAHSLPNPSLSFGYFIRLKLEWAHNWPNWDWHKCFPGSEH